MTERLDLPRRYREQLEALLREHVPGVDVWAYGSRVSGDSHEGSDLDLVLRSPTLEPLGAEYLDLVEALETSNIPILVQVHDWTRLPRSFHHEISRDYVVVQEAAKQSTAGEWRKVTLGDLLSLSNGASSPKRSGDSPHPVFGSNGIIGFSDETNTNPHTIIIGRVGSYCGSLYYSGKSCWVTDNAIRADTGNDAHPKFLYYLLHSLNLNEWKTGSGQPLLNQTILASIPTSVPPLPEQRAIAHVLGTLDDKIELNRRMNETLEEMARALFKSWFVDFDPVRAKAALKQHDLGHHAVPDGEPSGNGAAPAAEWTVERARVYLDGMDPQIVDLFPDRLVDSELGEIPDGWEVKALLELVELNPRESMKRGTIAPYLNMAALPTSGPSPDQAPLRKFKSGTRFRNGDTLFARITPCLENGKTAFIQSMPPSVVGWGSTEFIVMRAKPPVPPEYAYLLARDPPLRAHAIQNMTGTSGRQRARTEALASYLLPSSSRDVWMGFSSIARSIFSRIEANRRRSIALVAERDALLPKLMSGKLAVNPTGSGRL